MAKARTPRKRNIENYAHKGKERVNNPPVGLVTPQTDRDAGHRGQAVLDTRVLCLYLGRTVPGFTSGVWFRLCRIGGMVRSGEPISSLRLLDVRIGPRLRRSVEAGAVTNA